MIIGNNEYALGSSGPCSPASQEFLEIARLNSISLEQMLVPENRIFFGVPRSSSWPKVRKQWLLNNPSCEACGRTTNIEVHHILPYHLFPEYELNISNLMSLCDGGGRSCHFAFGHLYNWSKYNKNVREIVKQFCLEVQKWR